MTAVRIPRVIPTDRYRVITQIAPIDNKVLSRRPGYERDWIVSAAGNGGHPPRLEIEIENRSILIAFGNLVFGWCSG